jgi:hypothetical protein
MENTLPGRASIRRGALFILSGMLSLQLVACGNTKDAPANAGDVGNVQVALSLPDGSSITSVAWKVLSASNAVLASGTLNTTGPRTPSFISSMPPGTGDTLNMTAMTSTGVSCAGTSQPFDVVAGMSVTVDVNIICGNMAPSGDAGTLGSVVVTGTIVPGDNCPALTSWFITPQETMGSNPIDVSVMAADADMGETVTFAWSATSGSFASPTSATTQYTCGATGNQTLKVSITDNHMPTPCTTQVMFPAVTCD